jgi:hypothetical protein
MSCENWENAKFVYIVYKLRTLKLSVYERRDSRSIAGFFDQQHGFVLAVFHVWQMSVVTGGHRLADLRTVKLTSRHWTLLEHARIGSQMFLR